MRWSASGEVAGAPPAPARDVAPAEATRKAAVHLAIALVGFVVLAIAQLYAFTQAALLVGTGQAIAKIAFAVSAGAFLVLTILSLARQTTRMTLAYGGAVAAARRRFAERASWPGVSILVPAYNEAERIERALEAALALDYPRVEVVVVDDGSTDDTLARASRYAGRHGGKRVEVVHKENGGKWSALNLAFHRASEELVVCVDADSQLAPDSLKLLARHFDDPRLGGCCGQVSVRNRSTVIARLQALEYHLLNGLLRQAQSAFATVLVAPGPLAMFRRSVLEEVWRTWSRPARSRDGGARHVDGPWEGDTFAEDADLTLNVLLTGHGVTYEPLALSHTSAPEWTFRLLNQRYRWTRGNLQAAVKAWRRWHEAPAAPRMLPIWLGAFFFETIAWPAVNLLGLGAFLTMVVLFGVQAPLAMWFVALAAIDLNEAAFTARLERSDLRLLALMPLSRVYYNLLLDVSKFFALYDELRGRVMRWS